MFTKLSIAPTMVSDGTVSDLLPITAGAIGIATLTRGSISPTRYVVRPPNEWPDMPIRLGSSAPKKGDAGLAFAASI